MTLVATMTMTLVAPEYDADDDDGGDDDSRRDIEMQIEKER